ncbi:MAG: hypothetical protein ACREE2_00835 [Stellaceae bacterium]
MAARKMIGFAALAAGSVLAGCSTVGATACQCPKPVPYNEATIKAITAALKTLPPDSVLLAAMDDYEDERYNLRHCTGGQ